MNPSQPQDREQLLDAYLDGLLPDSQRADFERASADDLEFRMQIRLQTTIDEGLRRHYRPPAAPIMLPETNGRATGPAGAPSRLRGVDRTRRFAAAAVILIGLLGGLRLWIYLDSRPGPNPYDPGPKRTFAEAFYDEVRQGFKPDWVCEDQAESARTLRRRFGQALILDPVPGMAAIGWSYVNTTSPRALALLVYAGDERVIVFIDRAIAVPGTETPPDGGALHVYPRTVGGLALYEVSPLDRPVALDHFRIP